MKQKAILATDTGLAHLHHLGGEIRARRKALGVNATCTAESAGISRVTLHRIEKGEPSVAMGAYLNVMAALGLQLPAAYLPASTNAERNIPTKIKLAEFPQLRQLAWQIHGTDTLTPLEARDIYERNWRHLDKNKLERPRTRAYLRSSRRPCWRIFRCLNGCTINILRRYSAYWIVRF